MHGFATMPNMTIRVPEDLKDAMDDHPEINWSEVARRSMQEYLHKLEIADQLASKSELTREEAQELSDELKRDIGEHYEA